MLVGQSHVGLRRLLEQLRAAAAGARALARTVRLAIAFLLAAAAVLLLLLLLVLLVVLLVAVGRKVLKDGRHALRRLARPLRRIAAVLLHGTVARRGGGGSRSGGVVSVVRGGGHKVREDTVRVSLGH